VYASGTAENQARPSRAFGAMLPRMHLQLSASADHVAFHLQIAGAKSFDTAWLSKHFSACPQVARLGLREARDERFNRAGGPVNRAVGNLATNNDPVPAIGCALPTRAWSSHCDRSDACIECGTGEVGTSFEMNR
jgi:hypothetical protein